MKMIVAVAPVAVISTAPVQEESIPMVNSDFQQQPDGAYNYEFETGNGIVQSATGELKQAQDVENKPVTVLVMRGSYQYPGEDGKLVSITYYADETGFHAEGDSIPKPTSRR